jgi:hypothetical protein
MHAVSQQDPALKTAKKPPAVDSRTSSSLVLEVLSGPQKSVEIDLLPNRFVIGINREDADYSLFSSRDISALVEFSGYGHDRLEVHVIHGDLLIDGDAVSGGHAKTTSLPFQVSIEDIAFGLIQRECLVAASGDNLVDAIKPGVAATPSLRTNRAGIKIAVAFLFGAVAANHQFGLAIPFVATQVPTENLMTTQSLTHSDNALEFIQRAQYLGLSELVLKPLPDNIGTIAGSGYVRSEKELESVVNLAVRLGVPLVSKVVNVQALHGRLADALLEKRSSATVSYLGGGRFQVTALRSDVASTKEALVQCLQRDDALIGVSLLTSDSHRSTEREIGIELTAANVVASGRSESIPADSNSADGRQEVAIKPAIEKRSYARRNQFSSVLLGNGHRVYNSAGSSVVAADSNLSKLASSP